MSAPDPLDTARHAAQRIYLSVHSDIDRALFDFIYARELAIHVTGSDQKSAGYVYALAKRRALESLLREHRLLP